MFLGNCCIYSWYGHYKIDVCSCKPAWLHLHQLRLTVLDYCVINRWLMAKRGFEGTTPAFWQTGTNFPPKMVKWLVFVSNGSKGTCQFPTGSLWIQIVFLLRCWRLSDDICCKTNNIPKNLDLAISFSVPICISSCVKLMWALYGNAEYFSVWGRIFFCLLYCYFITLQY